MKLYREVKASERRFNGGTYFMGRYDNGFNGAHAYPDDWVKQHYWLEPIEITEEEIWKPGMDYFSTQIERLWIDSPMYGPTKAQVLDAWHKSFDIVLSKLKGDG